MTTIKTFTISTDTLNNKVNIYDLENEIGLSTITIALEEPKILIINDDLNIYFKTELTTSEDIALTNVVNKHLLPVYNKPMIYYPIQSMVDSGIRDILLVCGGQNAGWFRCGS